MVVYLLVGLAILAGRNEVGEVLEHPIVLEGVVDDSQEFARQGEVGFASTPPAPNTLIEILFDGNFQFDLWHTGSIMPIAATGNCPAVYFLALDASSGHGGVQRWRKGRGPN